jgi:hypothetical protein
MYIPNYEKFKSFVETFIPYNHRLMFEEYWPVCLNQTSISTVAFQSRILGERPGSQQLPSTDPVTAK